MAQTPIAVFSQNPGGYSSTLNVTAAAVIKASPGVLYKILVVAPGSAGSLTINDLTTTTGGAAANEILTIAFGLLTVGQVINLEWPCKTGISITAVTTGGQFSVAYA